MDTTTPLAADRTQPSPDVPTVDVAVVGGGPAGLSGAVALGRARRSVLVLDDGTPRNARAGHVHNYLTRDGTPPAELLALGRAEAEAYGVAFRDATVVAVERLDGRPDDGADGPHDVPARFELTLADGGRVRARRLLVTTGLTDVLPDVDGLAEHWGTGALHCPYCHGWEARDSAVVVLATGPMAAHQALMWRQWTADLTVAGPVAEDRREELDAWGVRVVPSPPRALVADGGRLTGVRLEDGTVVPCDAVVVASTMTARGALLAQLGLEVADVEVAGTVVARHVPAGPDGATAVDGVWVAGNVANPRAQVITSAAAGLDAGAAINAHLSAEQTTLLVAARRANAVA